MSEYIEKSKHPQLTAEVEAHFGYKTYELPPKPIQPPFGHPDTGVNYSNPEWPGSTPEMVSKYK